MSEDSSEYQQAIREEQVRAYDRGDEGVWDRGPEDNDVYEIQEKTNPRIADLFDVFDDLRASLIVRAPSMTRQRDSIEYAFESTDGTTQATLWDNEDDADKTRMEIRITDGQNITAVFFEGENVAIQEGTETQLKKRKAKAVPPETLSDEELEIAEKTTRDAMVKLYFNA